MQLQHGIGSNQIQEIITGLKTLKKENGDLIYEITDTDVHRIKKRMFLDPVYSFFAARVSGISPQLAIFVELLSAFHYLGRPVPDKKPGFFIEAGQKIQMMTTHATAIPPQNHHIFHTG